MSTRIRMQADDFFNAYQLLIESKLANVHPTLVPGVVCLAFSVELYIKDLHFVITGKRATGHNILDLFEGLPESIRQEIFSHDAISQNTSIAMGDPISVKHYSANYTAYDGFIDNIKLISDGFVKWRYSYESAALNYNSWFALAFIDAIKAVADDVRRHSRNPHPLP